MTAREVSEVPGLRDAIAKASCAHANGPDAQDNNYPPEWREEDLAEADAIIAALRTLLTEHPEAIAGLLPDEYNRHVYVIEPDDDWFLEHSIACRLDGLSNCPIHRAVARYDEPPEECGRYHVEIRDGELWFAPISEEREG